MTTDQTLLDAPTDQIPGAEGKAEGSLLDTKPAENADGKGEPQNPPASSDKTPPADPLKKPNATTDKPADKGQTPPAATGAPEKYAEPKLPEGMVLVPEVKSQFDSLAKELNLSQDQYQKVLDLQIQHATTQTKLVTDAFQKQISDWSDETKKELGADPDKSLAIASKAINTIFTDPKENKEFREMMKTSGLGNWRLMVKAFSFVGKSISEDRFVEGGPGGKEEKSIAERIYDKSTTK